MIKTLSLFIASFYLFIFTHRHGTRFKKRLAILFIFLFNSVSAQIITTYAGNGVAGYAGDGGLATKAQLLNPFGLAFDKDNNLYIVDNSNNRIRKVDVITKVISTVVGLGNNGGNCPLTQAGLSNPRGIAFDKHGNMYISDASTCLRKVDMAAQKITTIAGIRGTPNTYGNVLGDNGPALDAYFDGAAGIAIDNAGDVFVADMLNGRVRKIDVATGIITTFAGGAYFDGGNGVPATEAALNMPLSIAFDSKSNLYIADQGNHVIRKVDAVTNTISIVAGKMHTWGYRGDGDLAANALLNTPVGVAVDKYDNIYITDCLNNSIRMIDGKTGTISTIAGTGAQGYAGDCGQAKDARLSWPWEIVLDKAGQIYFTELQNDVVRTIGSQADLINGDKTICVNDSITLTALQAGGTWSSLNPNIATINSNGIVKGNASGRTDITYTVNISGCNTATDKISIQVFKPQSLFVGNDTAICKNTSLTIKADNVFKGYLWSTTDTTQSIEINSAGTYRLRATDVNSCVSSDSITITTLDVPVIDWPPDSSFCAGEEIVLTTPPDIKSAVWQNNTSAPFFRVTKSGNYSVTATGMNGCVDNASIQINAIPTPFFSLGADTTLCEGKTIFYDFDLPGAHYLWNNGSTSNRCTINKFGTYWLTITQQGCAASDTVTTSYKPAPILNLGNDTILCGGTTKLLSAFNTNATYLWQDGSGAASYLVDKAGLYTVTAAIDGCTASDTIHINYKPLPSFTFGKDSFLCTGSQLTLNPTMNTNVNYRWQDGSRMPFYMVTAPGLYTLVASNNCGSFTDSIKITTGLCNINMPTAFTPNKDGLNDIFRVKYPFAVKQYSLEIYNRWGQKIFESKDVANGWNGTNHGIEASMDTYIWIISLIDAEGKSKRRVAR